MGAHYLLSMLVGAEPRGLPGIEIGRISFQRAAEGSPLDDVVIHGHDSAGDGAVLEIQVKRSITFAPSDVVFRGVVEQIAKAIRSPDFWRNRHELAIATSRTSRKIDGAYQDVLTWARHLGSAGPFMSRIRRPGSANDDMRTFVSTLKTHLQAFGAPDDDDTVWGVLRRLLILPFDFRAPGSASEILARERATAALDASGAAQAGTLWVVLTKLAIDVAASGGERTRETLVEDLKALAFPLAGQRRFARARAALAESSRAALADINDRVGDATLGRHLHTAAVHAALDIGRYVEIRGDAGVGKSGVLKHFAQQVCAEGRAIVLSPDRVVPRGWSAMQGAFGVDGTARDLLVDLAASGGVAVFVDNLELFDPAERKTVIDLVRAAADVAGVVVVSTARRDFGTEEPSWLPADALQRLGRAEPIVIDELSEADVSELVDLAPNLAPLLADSHPARAVARNLYRLSRLVAWRSDEPTPRTEVDMAEQWWRTADGTLGPGHRERARLLRALAEQALTGPGSLDATTFAGSALDELVRSETLRELGTDRITFRHDVLREWAIAQLLSADGMRIEQLPLLRPAPSVLARGVELAARAALERTPDASAWRQMLERVSQPGAHGSWRRAVLLAIPRSENGPELLERVSSLLLADQGRLFRELIRAVVAVEMIPAAELFSKIGVTLPARPLRFDVPSGPTWYRLIRWLLNQGDSLPATAMPEVVDLYSKWPLGMLGQDPVTPVLVSRMYRWLRGLEAPSSHTKGFQGDLEPNHRRLVEPILRDTFLLFCNRTPSLAADYLRVLRQRPGDDETVRGILKFRGFAAQAAPRELADLTAHALIRQRSSSRHARYDALEGPFQLRDHDFLPASPAQGPFFELLTHGKHHGLALIRRLVDHAIEFHSRGRPHGTNAFAVALPDGDRLFPWRQSYGWSRGGGRSFGVTSALMALEVWAHKRLDAGDAFDDVLLDVLGQPGAPAAYLAIAVDLLLSHWPRSETIAVPFLACPELLCIDLQRHVEDNMEVPDFFGLADLQKEPSGPVTLDDLKRRPSRRRMLSELLPHYAMLEPPDLRQRLADLLRRATERLGPPAERSDKGDPAFMAQHALNVIDPTNWVDAAVQLADGRTTPGREYIPPQAEALHLKPLQDEALARRRDIEMRLALGAAVAAPASSQAFAQAAVEWAQASGAGAVEELDSASGSPEAVVAAAMVAMRDGDPELRSKHRDWAMDVFARTFQSDDDPVHRVREGLRFNPPAIAMLGMIHALKDDAAPAAVQALLSATNRPAAAYGFGAALRTLSAIDERYPRAVLRCALSASVRRRRRWSYSDDELPPTRDEEQTPRAVAIQTELDWLAGNAGEAAWPAFPLETKVRSKRGPTRFEASDDATDEAQTDTDVFVDHQAAAMWLTQTLRVREVAERPWVLDLVRHYSEWTRAANGAGLAEDQEISRAPDEWTRTYFSLVAVCIANLPAAEVGTLVTLALAAFPDDRFLDVVAQFLPRLDEEYFNDSGVKERTAVQIRTGLAERLLTTREWHRVAPRRDSSIGWHIGPAIGAFFFNSHSGFDTPQAYLRPKGIDKLEPFLPCLQRLIDGAPCVFVALVALNLVEVSPRASHLTTIVRAARRWLEVFPDARDFWITYGIGARVCAVLEAAAHQDPSALDKDMGLRGEVDALLAALVALGIPDAARVERGLANPQAN